MFSFLSGDITELFTKTNETNRHKTLLEKALFDVISIHFYLWSLFRFSDLYFSPRPLLSASCLLSYYIYIYISFYNILNILQVSEKLKEVTSKRNALEKQSEAEVAMLHTRVEHVQQELKMAKQHNSEKTEQLQLVSAELAMGITSLEIIGYRVSLLRWQELHTAFFFFFVLYYSAITPLQ